MQHCNSTGTTCQFPGLNCGEMYNFTVMAFSQGCSSLSSSSVYIQTGTAQFTLEKFMAFQVQCLSSSVII